MRKARAAFRGARIYGLGALTAAALALAGCGYGGYGSTAGSSGPTRPGRGPASTVPAGVPAAAAPTLTPLAVLGSRLDGAEVFGPVHASVYGQGPFDLGAGRGSEVI